VIDPAFTRALERIPEQLRRDEFRFNQILSRQKVPVGQAWNAAGGANYAWDDPKMAGWLYEGHNYGVNCGHGGLVVPDLDDPARLEELGNIAKFPETFTVRTGRGGYHYYYICPELKEKIIIYDPELTDSDGDPLHLGEVQTVGQQVVGPGSVHPNGKTYEVINPASIAEISKEALLACLQGLRLSSDKNGQNEDHARGRRSRCSGGGAGALISIDEVCWPDNVIERAGSEARGSHPLHGSDTGKNFAVNTSKNAWHCFRHGTGGDALVWLAVEAKLIRCEDARPGCLSDKEMFKAVLKIAEERGFQINDGDDAKQCDRNQAEAGQTHELDPTVIDAMKALDGVCDGAHTKDGTGFNKFDRSRLKSIIEKVRAGEALSEKEENRAYYALRKYSKQLASLGIDYNNIDTIKHSETGEGDRDKETQGTALVRLVEEAGAELWHTPSREPYITVNVSGHLENYLLGSQAARDWISRLFYQEQEKSPANQSLYDALGVLRGKALFDGPEYQTHCRLAGHHDRVYIDLGRPDWEAVEVSAEGWQVISQAPVKFIRPSEMLPMPLPERGGQWDDLRGLVNAQEDDTWILMVAWLMQAFWPAGPFVHLVLIGEQGSTKSTVSRILKRLADPSKGGLWGRPKDPQSLLIQALWARIVGLDNLSGVIDGWFSDALCGLSTGTATGQRRLYTDFDQAILEVMRPALMNGIDVVLPRGDLADRTIILELLPVVKRMRADEIESDFLRVWPFVLGLLLDATAKGLKNAGTVDLSDLPRMADFTAWVMACEEDLPWEHGEFKAAYTRNRLGRALEQVMIDPFARAIYEWLQENPDPITATPTGFLTMLEVRGSVDTARRPHGWPADPARLGTKVRRIAPILRHVGIRVEISRSSGKRMVRASLENDVNAVNSDGMDSRVPVKGTVKPIGYGHRVSVDGNPYFHSGVKKKKKKEGEEEEELDRKGREKTVITGHTVTVQQAALESHSDGNVTQNNTTWPHKKEQIETSEPDQPVATGLAEFKAKVAADQKKHCHRCSALLDGIGGRQASESLHWYCDQCWQADHPRPGTPDLAAPVNACDEPESVPVCKFCQAPLDDGGCSNLDCRSDFSNVRSAVQTIVRMGRPATADSIKGVLIMRSLRIPSDVVLGTMVLVAVAEVSA